MYSVITENDESRWKDITGDLYHFPSRYKKFLEPGTKIIYYKGQLKNRKYKDKRLTSLPHYFGLGNIEDIYNDEESTKNDYYARITGFLSFTKPVYAKCDGLYLEKIPENRLSNYWRDGVRKIDVDVYSRIINLANLSEDMYNDSEQGGFESFTPAEEGTQTRRITTTYERDRYIRSQAIRIHGYTCQGCGFNFGEFYGEQGIGYIHVHHIKPLSETGQTIVNPQYDMVVLCANCHAIVHRRRNYTLSMDELRGIIEEAQNNSR